MPDDYTPQEVLNTPPLPEGCIPTAVVLIVEYLDPETNDKHMMWVRDTDSPIWTCFGMTTAVAKRLGKNLIDYYHVSGNEDDEDED